METSSEFDASLSCSMSSEEMSSSSNNISSSSEDISSSSETNSQCSESNDDIAIMHPSVEQSFSGSEICVFQKHFVMYLFNIKHCLTNEGRMELLAFVKVHMPMSDNLPTSAYTLKQFFATLFPDLISSIHYYCSCCH